MDGASRKEEEVGEIKDCEEYQVIKMAIDLTGKGKEKKDDERKGINYVKVKES